MALVNDPEIEAALKSCGRHFAFSALYSFFANLLLFAFPLFMLNVYGRVITSRSLATLVVLLIGFVIAIIFKGIFNWLRSALLVRAAVRLDRRLTARVLQCLFERRASGRTDIGPQALRDLDQFRQFVAGAGGIAAIDAPWGGLFLGALLVLNTPMGVTALVAILLITALTIADMFLTRAEFAKSDKQTLGSYLFVEANLPTAEAVVGMGFMRTLLEKWQSVREPALAAQIHAANRSNAFDDVISVVRYVAQGVLIAVGVVEVIGGAVTPGVLIGALFIFNFAMTPFNKIVHAWSSYNPIKQGLRRLETVLRSAPKPLADRMALPRPAGELTVRQIAYVPSGEDRPILRNISFGLKAGQSLGMIGLVGSGKTTLARHLVGVLKPTAGSVRLDGHDAWDWVRNDGGRFVGYVPQSVGLLTATVAENIGRFGLFGEDQILAAAELAAAHQLIQKLPLGYDTLIGDGGHPLSGGQRQLVALARAVVGLPSLVVLDEPNANLDGPGEEALMRCIGRLKEVGSTVVVISHRPQLVRGLDKLLLLKEGQLVAFGESEEIWRELGRPTPVVARIRAGDSHPLAAEVGTNG